MSTESNIFKVDGNGNVLVSQYDLLFGEDASNGVIKTETRVNYTTGTTSQQILAGPGRLFGLIVGTSTGASVKLWDNTAASGTAIAEAIFLPQGASNLQFPAIVCTTGLYITTTGTLTYTALTKLDN